MTYKKIRDLKVGDNITQVFLIASIEQRKTKSGKPYGQLVLKDFDGELMTKVWDFAPSEYPEIKPGVYASMTVEVEEFKGTKSGKSKIIPIPVDKPTDVSLYLSDKGLSNEKIEEYWGYLLDVMKSVQDPFIKEYLNIMFDPNCSLVAGFKTGAASSSNRGAFRGGLIEHVAKVMRNALALIETQKFSSYGEQDINRDLIIAGVLAHDIGKVYTYNVTDLGTKQTSTDRLIGHLALSYGISVQNWIAVESSLRRAVPEITKDLINHIILSHHGKPDYGSPVSPRCIEAWIVHISDHMDSSTTNYVEQSNVEDVDELGYAAGNFVTGKLFVEHYGQTVSN